MLPTKGFRNSVTVTVTITNSLSNWLAMDIATLSLVFGFSVGTYNKLHKLKVETLRNLLEKKRIDFGNAKKALEEIDVMLTKLRLQLIN